MRHATRLGAALAAAVACAREPEGAPRVAA
ncbi:MAG: hypothetical protein AVDCRST_MAG40-2988, partial [uncultured Gemmatimonadaceae bacterium]